MKREVFNSNLIMFSGRRHHTSARGVGFRRVVEGRMVHIGGVFIELSLCLVSVLSLIASYHSVQPGKN